MGQTETSDFKLTKTLGFQMPTLCKVFTRGEAEQKDIWGSTALFLQLFCKCEIIPKQTLDFKRGRTQIFSSWVNNCIWAPMGHGCYAGCEVQVLGKGVSVLDS